MARISTVEARRNSLKGSTVQQAGAGVRAFCISLYYNNYVSIYSTFMFFLSLLLYILLLFCSYRVTEKFSFLLFLSNSSSHCLSIRLSVSLSLSLPLSLIPPPYFSPSFSLYLSSFSPIFLSASL